MIYSTRSGLIVMVTPLIEGGRVFFEFVPVFVRVLRFHPVGEVQTVLARD